MRLPYAAIHRRSFAPLVRAGHLDTGVLDATTSTGWTRRRPPLAPPLLRRLPHPAPPRTAPAPPRHRLPHGGHLGPHGPVPEPVDRDPPPAGSIPDAELTVLDGTGHWVMDESPAEVTAALEPTAGTPRPGRHVVAAHHPGAPSGASRHSRSAREFLVG
ncbi:hypothetical protein LV779_04185 [Streptomyces thinghirensis]|nr:hypothetical protein [Streptomyces thinghirensis]